MIRERILDWRWSRLQRKVDDLAAAREAAFRARYTHIAPHPLIAGPARVLYAPARTACPDTVAELIDGTEWTEL